ncbi:MAG TPA: amino acid adenylation domain-containing protein [Gaiellaceae bacterium]|nr:amino acid adenylation domain-containing protein [Gaiellaceae bacterium]
MIAAEPHGPLCSRFLRAAETFSDRPAVEAAGRTLTYGELRRRALAIAARLLAEDPEREAIPLTGVYATRTVDSFAAVLGILLRGHGYVPLNPRFPALRNREILERAGCRAVVVDPDHLDAAVEVTSGLAKPPTLVVPTGLQNARDFELPPSGPATPAYLLFTSGSTGRPKGVLVRQANVAAFLGAVADRYDLNETDRLSQLFDLTFDLSAFDMFGAWHHGACVCCPAAGELLRPADFVREASLSVWFSVPSSAMFLDRLGGLKPDTFPSLRLSLFCGEALPAELANTWAAAAPNSIVENLYGPTEATIACTAHRWEPGAPAGANGFVPIGEPIGATKAWVVDEELHEVRPGEVGQLLLGGPQVVEGYWDDREATDRSFVTTPAGNRGYLTGDRVTRPTEAAPLEYVGRIDGQIKVLGHRVELEEIESVLREEAGAEAAAVGWPRTSSGAAGIVAFIASTSVDTVELRRAVSARLPDYMVPRELRLVGELPLNANGKRDRKALLSILEAG